MRVLGLGLLLLLAGGAALAFVYPRLMNPRVIRELREHPEGERARRVMLLGLPSGKEIPVNYLRDEGVVWAAADFPWWRELREPGPVRVLIRGETLLGRGRAVLDDPELRSRVFARLRPTAPGFAGTLVEIRLDPPG